MWYAGSARNVVLKRAVAFADGFYALLIPPEEPRMAMERLRRHLGAAGKDPSAFSVVGLASNRAPGARTSSSIANQGPWLDRAKLWAELGATHISVSSMGSTVQESLAMAAETKKVLDLEIGAA
jgi:alkanesulfonate monooxygenase SsuD/methylene tetrahydromethanopterin reductase-like flavin-dependent oxidoreductase (luciferase family)